MAECAEEAEIAQISLKELNAAKSIDDVLELAQEAVQNAAGQGLNLISKCFSWAEQSWSFLKSVSSIK